ncbi:hypothetical protein HDU76_013111 [Blyttiomyces sp. JEL0837]|nr:hypothetical protein HDU76_013111 [Blyttiomyces sp. JEL0837]
MAKVMEMRQAKNQRDTQIAMNIAMTKDRIYWMTGFAGALGTIGLARTIAHQKPAIPVASVPGLIFTTLLLYQADMVWGNKMNRIHTDAEEIKKDPRFWFNEKMKLPPAMKGAYRKAMDELNRDLEKAGEPKVAEWAE